MLPPVALRVDWLELGSSRVLALSREDAPPAAPPAAAPFAVVVAAPPRAQCQQRGGESAREEEHPTIPFPTPESRPRDKVLSKHTHTPKSRSPEKAHVRGEAAVPPARFCLLFVEVNAVLVNRDAH